MVFTTKNSIIVNAAVIETAKMWLKYKLIINIKELKNMEINVHMTIVMIIIVMVNIFLKSDNKTHTSDYTVLLHLS